MSCDWRFLWFGHRLQAVGVWPRVILVSTSPHVWASASISNVPTLKRAARAAGCVRKLFPLVLRPTSIFKLAPSKSDDYLLVEMSNEIARLTAQHYMIKERMNDKLVVAALDLQRRGLRVLDSACADGPSCQVLLELG